DAEHAAGQLLGRELSRVRVLLEALSLLRERGEVLPVGVAHHRDEQAVLDRYRDADVHAILAHERAAVEARAEPRMRGKCLRGRRDDGVGVRRACLLALRVRARYVDVPRAGELGGSASEDARTPGSLGARASPRAAEGSPPPEAGIPPRREGFGG